MSAVSYTSSAQQVANAFVTKYYNVLHYCPQNADRLYLESSRLCWADDGDVIVEPVTTLQGIHDKIVTSLLYRENWSVVIKTVDAQESLDGGVLLVVTGCFTIGSGKRENFHQTFLLVKRGESVYAILHDILRFVDVHEPATPAPAPAPTPTCASKAVETPVMAATEEEGEKEEGGNIFSYASMTSKPTSPTEAPAAPVCVRVSANANHYSDALKEKNPPTNKDSTGTINHDHAPNAEARGIYIKGLPNNITTGALIEAVKQFGRLRRVPNCVKIRRYEDGSCSGLVDFELPDSAHQAVEAGHIIFGEYVAAITHKRPPNRGGNREGPPQNSNFRRPQSAQGYAHGRSQNGNRPGSRNY